MESYSQPWTVVDKYESTEPKTHEYYAWENIRKGEKSEWNKPECYYKGGENKGEWNKPEYYYKGGENKGEWNKPEYYYKGEKSEWNKPEYYYKGEKSEWNKPEHYYKGERSEWNKPEQYYKGERSEWNKPEHYYKGERSEWNKPEHYYKGERSEWNKPEQYYKGERSEWNKPEYYQQGEKIYGEWEKVCDDLERLNVQKREGSWSCKGRNCCDDEMVTLIKNMINILIGAEQSYIQLGFLCMDEKFTLTNTSEYFRLNGLRMRWMAHGLIKRSVRLFNVNEWINNTTFENWFKVPTKEEMATNDFTGLIKTFFKIAVEAECRLVEKMIVLGDKLKKFNWTNTECNFEGFNWYLNFVLPYQIQFVRDLKTHLKNIEMCNNGYVFDKYEMRPLVQKIEEFIHQIVNSNKSAKWENKTVITIKQW